MGEIEKVLAQLVPNREILLGALEK